jgi:hypothetical protein
LYSLAAW